ncbi:MAG: translesion DNA synthesis-associated protein ImuA [Burkholderiaceae bacterium]
MKNEAIHSLLRQEPRLWRAASLGTTSLAPGQEASLATGHPELNQQLPGQGWPKGCLTELLVRALGIGEMRLLAPALSLLAQQKKKIIFLAPPHMPYAPALSALGLSAESILIVRAQNTADRLWAFEQTLRSNAFGALLAWVDEPSRNESLRRFQLASRTAEGPVFLFRPWSAQNSSSPAPLRLCLLPRRYPGLAVQIIKRRGPVQLDPVLVNLPIAHPAMQSLSRGSKRSSQQPTHPALGFNRLNAHPQLQTSQIQGIGHALDRLPPTTALSSVGSTQLS